MTKPEKMDAGDAKDILLTSAVDAGRQAPDMAGVLSDGLRDGMLLKLRQGPFSKGYYRFAL